MLGKGTYDKEHDVVHEQCGATSSILIVLDGKKGQGMSCKIHEKHLKMLPDILRTVADGIGPELEDDLKQIAIIKGEQPNAKSTTEDSGPQSFAG